MTISRTIRMYLCLSAAIALICLLSGLAIGASPRSPGAGRVVMMMVSTWFVVTAVIPVVHFLFDVFIKALKEKS
ncbi:hypothetical protein D3C87_1249410 [compost metagenome]